MELKCDEVYERAWARRSKEKLREWSGGGGGGGREREEKEEGKIGRLENLERFLNSGNEGSTVVR